MNPLSAADAGLRKDRETSVRYEVRRLREDGANGATRSPIVEEFLALDRARLAALSHALDGPTVTGDRFTGTMLVFQVLRGAGGPAKPTLIDVIDERVAFRLLNETRLPRADQLAVSLDRLQAQIDGLNPY
jgi:hypothetical protein